MQSPPAFLQQRLEFPFASAEARAGLPLSNRLFGALLWGVGRTLHVTIKRADYSPRGSVRGEDDDPPAMPMAAAPALPMGRLDMHLPPDWSVATGGLHLLTGEAEIELTSGRPEGAWAK